MMVPRNARHRCRHIPVAADATVKQIDAVVVAARALRHVGAEALPKMKGGLRALYRTLELPGANPLRDAHAALDAAVLNTYGFNAKKDLLAQLLALNQEVAAMIERGEPVTAPGVPQESNRGALTVNSPLKKLPGEGTGTTIRADFRGNVVGRVPSRGKTRYF